MRPVKWGCFFTSLVALLTILFLNTRGILEDWNYWFFQIEHFVGGFFLVMFLFSFSAARASILLALGILGILWECFEYAVVYSPIMSDFIGKFLQVNAVSFTWQDTISDIVLDFGGGFCSYYLINKRSKRG